MQKLICKRKLSEILDEIGKDDELADRIEAASIELRQSKCGRQNYDDCTKKMILELEEAISIERTACRLLLARG